VILYPNKYPDQFAEEMRDAERAGLEVVRAPSVAFEALASAGDPLIYVVRDDLSIVVSPRTSRLVRMTHSVLAEGSPVLAAGEVNLVVGDGYRAVLVLNNYSGHYQPDDTCLDIAAKAFEQLGFEVSPKVLESFVH
jgi:hypothetical protein